MKRNLKLLAVSATTAITCGVIAQTVPLQNATATFSQTFFANLSVAFAIDDNPLTGWAIGTENSTKSETAVFETVEDIQLASAKELVFRLKCGAFLGAQFNNIGRFRLSATSDDRSEFADGLPTGGDVTANWEVLEPLVFTSASGAILTKLADNSLLASGVNPPDSETYTVIATSKLTRITGFRLETMEDDSLPDRGPGRSFNGNFVLYDFSVGLAGKVVSGTIVSQVWMATNSPYLVVGDIQVASLTIQPGVTVLMSGNYAFEVAGTLKAIGTPTAPILFTVANSGWQGIFFNYAQPGSEMAHCVIEKSLNSGIRILNSIPAISDCVIRGNSAANGGAINTDSPLKLDNCLVLNNTANSRGGGIYSTAPLSLLNCIVSTNSASVEGGGISSGANLILQSSLILGNSTAGIRGGGISSGAGSVHRNSIIAANASGSQGAGLYSTGGDALVENCTIAFNKPDGLGSDTNGTKVINSIVWGNTTTQIGGTTNVTYCDVQGGMAGLGNKNASPIFLSSSDLIIVPGSPCINAGNTNAAYTNVFFPPSLGKIHNDMGAHGGPGAGARLRARYNQQMEVVFLSGVPGYSYQIQASTDLSAWQTVEQVQIAHLGDYATFLEPSTNTIPFRFYRLNVGQ